MTRIVAGRWRGRTLRTPPGEHTRPTNEKVRAALGNSLQATGALVGATVLDLFAGTGALGLELASRGAERVVLVDNDREALAAARANVQTLAATGVQVVGATVAAYIAGASGTRFDIVVADPPYDLPTNTVVDLLRELATRDLLAPGADVIIERSRRDAELPWPDPLVGLRVKRFGDTVLLFGRAP